LDKTTRFWNIDGSLIQKFSGFGYTVNSVSFSPDGQHVLIGSEDGTTRLWKIKESLKEYKTDHNYQELSIAQKIRYGILEFSDVIKINNENDIDEAAEYYYGEINRVGKEQKDECIRNAINLYDILIGAHKNNDLISRRDSLIMKLKN
jgi:WD40 repeat protein